MRGAEGRCQRIEYFRRLYGGAGRRGHKRTLISGWPTESGSGRRGREREVAKRGQKVAVRGWRTAALPPKATAACVVVRQHCGVAAARKTKAGARLTGNGDGRRNSYNQMDPRGKPPAMLMGRRRRQGGRCHLDQAHAGWLAGLPHEEPPSAHACSALVGSGDGDDLAASCHGRCRGGLQAFQRRRPLLLNSQHRGNLHRQTGQRQGAKVESRAGSRVGCLRPMRRC